MIHTMEGFQFSIEWNPAALQQLAPVEGLLKQENLGQRWSDEGILTVSWNNKGDELLTPLPLLGLTFEAAQDGDLSHYLWIGSRLTPAEAYPVGAKTANVKLHFTGDHPYSGDATPQLQVWPNPFSSDFNLRFYHTEDGMASIKILDVYGRILFTRESFYQKGWCERKINRYAIGQEKGVFWVCIESAQGATWEQVVAH